MCGQPAVKLCALLGRQPDWSRSLCCDAVPDVLNQLDTLG